MKYIRYQSNDGVRLAVEDQEGEFAPVNDFDDLVVAMEQEVDLVALGESTLSEPTRVAIEIERVIAPLDPPSMRDSMCFHEHVRNCRLEAELDSRHSEFPTFYISNHHSVVGPYEDVRISPGSAQFDYELEVCAVIGKEAYNVRPSEAQSIIAGYTMYIDWSARDLQLNEMALGLGPAKGKDSATTLGPKFVTADEFQDRRSGKGYDITMRAMVNGEQVSEGNWNTIDWSFEDVISYTSRGTRLVPGDVLGSGTVGWGCLYEFYKSAPDKFPGWLKEGDIVELSIDGIGSTRQRIVEPLEVHPLSSSYQVSDRA